MKIGLSTPVVTRFPGVAAEWERDGEADDVARIATTADELGFAYVTASEHVVIPDDVAATRGPTYWDPVATLSFLAAHTSSIRLVTSVVVLGYHHPLAIAKRYGTVDRLSGGRLVLGVGVGSLQAEFELLGAAFDDRGARADDAIRALRASLSNQRPEFHGEFYDFDGVVLDPCAVQPRVPIWVGGRTLRSLRRAVELADGWMPFALGPVEVAKMLGRVDVPANFEVLLPTGRAVDPIGSPDAVTRELTILKDAGATGVTCSVAANSPAHYCEQLSALRDIADDIAEESR